MEERTNTSIQCQDKHQSKELLSNWSMVDPITFTTTKSIYTFSIKQSEADDRFVLKDNKLIIENVKLSDKGHYQGKLIDEKTGEVVSECITRLLVYSKYVMCHEMTRF